MDDPDELRARVRALDVPAARFATRRSSAALAAPAARGHELAFCAAQRPPVKVALPGPYLLTRTIWLECVSDRAYASREALAADIVRVLREELAYLLADGAALVQLDEPVLTEVVFGRRESQRSFMCGALSERGDPDAELALRRAICSTRSSRAAARAAGAARLPRQLDARRARGAGRRLRPLLPCSRPGRHALSRAGTPRAGELDVLARPARRSPRRRRGGQPERPRGRAVDEIVAPDPARDRRPRRRAASS